MGIAISSLSQFSILATSLIVLAGCGGGGGLASAVAKDAAEETGKVVSSTKKLDNIHGTMGLAMDVDKKVYKTTAPLTSAIEFNSLDGRLTADTAPKFTLKKNFIGGVDVTVDGKKISFDEKAAQSDTAWYKEFGSGATRYGLSLWNAGRDGRDGLTENAAGQNYHKIIGYADNDSSYQTTRGHAVYGETTPLDAVADLEKKATYKGYFVTNVTPGRIANTGYELNSENISGDLRFVADFDNNTISGKSGTVSRRGAGAIQYKEELFDLRFKSAAIKNDGNGGVVYSGEVQSDYMPLNGATYTGSFFGPDAQEVAGTITGTTYTGTQTIGSDRIVDGFFSGAR